MKKCLYVCVTVFSVLVFIVSQVTITKASTPRYQAPRFYSIDELIEWIETADSSRFQSGRFGWCLHSARNYGEILIPAFDNSDIVLRSVSVQPRVHESGRFVHSGYMLTMFSYSTPEGSMLVTIHRPGSSYIEIYENYGITDYHYATIEGTVEAQQSLGETTIEVRNSCTGEIATRSVSYVFIDFPGDRSGVVIRSIIDGREVHMQFQNKESPVNFYNMVLETVPITDRFDPATRPPWRTIRFEIGNPDYTINGAPHTNDVAPFIDPTYNRAMVPVRAVSEALVSNVGWNSETRTVIISSVVTNGTYLISVDTPLPDGMGSAVIRDDRVFVPIRYVAEVLGATARWDGENSAVYIYL